MKNNPIINVCLASGESYFRYMATAIVSILKTAAPQDRFRFYILCNQVGQSYKKQLELLKKWDTCNITFIDVDNKEFDAFPSAGAHITNTTYFRYKIAQLCPGIDKIIYLDCDTLVTQSLAQLFAQDLTGYYVAGVEDVGYYYWKNHNPNFIYKTDFYINTGVLLINLSQWRKDNLFDKLVKFTNTHANQITIGDQDVINQVCRGKIKPLDYKWNVQDSFYRPKPERAYNPHCQQITQAAAHPAIIHYTQAKKPWGDMFCKVAKRTCWLFYNRFSPFATYQDHIKYFVAKYIFSKERSVHTQTYTFLGLHYNREYREK